MVAARETYGEKDGLGLPFINCDVDIFGPFVLKGRKELKRYAALFICLASRLFHIENTCNMDTLS